MKLIRLSSLFVGLVLPRLTSHDLLEMADERLTHLDATGQARMVDVSDKEPTVRRAVARATVFVSPPTAHSVQTGDTPKGEVLGTARLAGIQAAKRTSELIPLCHPLALSYVGVEASVDVQGGQITLTAEARTTGPTGVEMEALTAATVAALTVYDMVKGIERGARIAEVVLLEKSGGRSGEWRRGEG
jgi:cyclic pyranopterin phosphate synthase